MQWGRENKGGVEGGGGKEVFLFVYIWDFEVLKECVRLREELPDGRQAQCNCLHVGKRCFQCFQNMAFSDFSVFSYLFPIDNQIIINIIVFMQVKDDKVTDICNRGSNVHNKVHNTLTHS